MQIPTAEEAATPVVVQRKVVEMTSNVTKKSTMAIQRPRYFEMKGVAVKRVLVSVSAPIRWWREVRIRSHPSRG